MTTRTFTMFRRGDLSETHDVNQRPPSPDEPAFWGVVWPDGTCTLRWAGVVAATSVWASFDDAMKVHGHSTSADKHDSLLVWDTPPIIPPPGFGTAAELPVQHFHNGRPCYVSH